MLIIRKLSEDDVDALDEITSNDQVYRFIPPFQKSCGNLIAAIRNLGGREFDKERMIGAGIYLCGEPNTLIGLAEMFDIRRRKSR